MASVITFLLPLVLLVASCQCAPDRVGAGFKLGGKSDLDFALGGNLAGTVDGASISGGGNGVLGAKWRGNGYGGAYGLINDKYYGAEGSANAALGGSLRPGFSGAVGRDSKEQWKLGLTPTFGITNEALLNGNGALYTEDDAKRMAAGIGDFGGFNAQPVY